MSAVVAVLLVPVLGTVRECCKHRQLAPCCGKYTYREVESAGSTSNRILMTGSRGHSLGDQPKATAVAPSSSPGTASP